RKKENENIRKLNIVETGITNINNTDTVDDTNIDDDSNVKNNSNVKDYSDIDDNTNICDNTSNTNFFLDDNINLNNINQILENAI
ncbi:1109_t:CDS:1, partial [Cetraspora pellucida]